jgi:type VI secretion system protein ImpE
VFEGRKSPMVLGQPDQWLALLIESRLRAGLGEAAQAEDLRQRAFEEAPACRGQLDARPFEWIADADSRLGPVMEAIINGRYYWIPFARLAHIKFDPPEDLRDCVWLPAHLQFENGGETLALVPTRYEGTHACGDGALQLARKTEWRELRPEVWAGSGQRMFGGDDGEEHAMLDVREILFSAAAQQEPAHG